jgi:hypothetical protein
VNEMTLLSFIFRFVGVSINSPLSYGGGEGALMRLAR